MIEFVMGFAAGAVCASVVPYVRDWALKLYTSVKALLEQYRGQ